MKAQPAIAGCSRSPAPNGLPPMRTNLWIEDSDVLIRFADQSGRVFKWCNQRHIRLVDPAMEAVWLRNNR